MNRSKAREHAFQILFSTEFQMLSDKEDPLEKLDQVITDHLMTFQDQDEKMTLEEEKFIRREVTGTMTHLKELDEAISEHLKGWSLNRLGRVDLSIMRLALYEIRYEKDIPDRVSINEAVELAKKYGEERSGKFINGVLANFAEPKENGPKADGPKADEPAEIAAEKA